MLGISIRTTIGIGDQLQFSSLPENYYRARGERLFDMSGLWFFDHNPYVSRDPLDKPTIPALIKELWNFGDKQYVWPRPRVGAYPQVYQSNAEIWAAYMGVPVTLNRPRLYRFEGFPFAAREDILFQTTGRSHGVLPEEIVRHVLEKYGPTGRLKTIGPKHPMLQSIPHYDTPTLWDLAEVISKASMLIAPDSGPSWIGACYPDVRVKKIRTKPDINLLKDWVPLDIQNIHAHWDDRCHEIFNVSEYDVGFTQSYLRI